MILFQSAGPTVLLANYLCIVMIFKEVSCKTNGLRTSTNEIILSTSSGRPTRSLGGNRTAVSEAGNNAERMLQFTGFDDLPCGITSFSVYNSSNKEWRRLNAVFINDMFRSQLILDQYPKWNVNIRADIDTTGCPEKIVKCVRIKLDVTQRIVDRTRPPYMLWSELSNGEPSTGFISPHGFKTLQGQVYENDQCAGEDFCHEQVAVHVIPQKNPFLDLQRVPFVVSYDNALPTSNDPEVREVENHTCDFIRKALSTKLVPRGSLIVAPGDKYYCWKPSGWESFSSKVPVRIPYSIVVGFTYSGISVFSNPDMVTKSDLELFIRRLFRDEVGIGSSNETMSSYVKRLVSVRNPFYNFTRITIA